MSPELAGPFRQRFQNTREAALQAFPGPDFGQDGTLNYAYILL